MLQPHIIIRILIAYNPASLRLLRTILRWLKKCQITHKQQGQLNLWLNYPCLCLCLGFSQIILMLPFLLITLHFSQIGLTDDLTFTANPPFFIKVPIYRYDLCWYFSKSVRIVLYTDTFKKSIHFLIYLSK